MAPYSRADHLDQLIGLCLEAAYKARFTSRPLPATVKINGPLFGGSADDVVVVNVAVEPALPQLLRWAYAATAYIDAVGILNGAHLRGPYAFRGAGAYSGHDRRDSPRPKGGGVLIHARHAFLFLSLHLCLGLRLVESHREVGKANRKEQVEDPHVPASS